MIYLDHAATSFPKPGCVAQAMTDFLATSAANPGRGAHALSIRASQVVDQARLTVSRFFHCPSPQRLVFASNATCALNMALKGVLLPGDHVVTTSMDHNAVARPLVSLERAGVQVTRVTASTDGKVAPESIRQALRHNTKLVVICHASNVSGAISPIGSIGQIAREHGAWLLVDAAQTAGCLSIDVQRDGIDMLAFPGHKGLLGPPGTGGLWVDDRIALRPWIEGGTGILSDQEDQPSVFPHGFESGTLNTVGIAGLAAAVGFVQSQGIQEIHARESALCARLVDGLRAMGKVTVYGPKEPEDRCAVVSFNLADWDPVDVSAVLDQSFGIASRAGLHCAPWAHRTMGTYPAGTVRLSLGWTTTQDEIDQALTAVRSLAQSR